MFRRHAALILAAMLCATGYAQAQSIDTRHFNVIGTFNFLTNWNVLEKPFWTEEIVKASGGKLTANIRAYNELGLKGPEMLRLLKQGVFDFAFVIPIFVEDGGAIIEAVDISGVARSFEMSREIAQLWMPEMQKVMKDKYNSMIVATHTWPEQGFYCRGDITSVEDLKGKKVRVQGTSQSDLVSALGGAGVTIMFGEVVPALEKGVVECGITGTMPAYRAKWTEVTNTYFRLPVGFTAGFLAVNITKWNGLSEDTRALMVKKFQELEDKSWKTTEAETEDGVHCTTGTGTCPLGPPGKLKLVKPSDKDKIARDKALNEVVLKNWARRCGAECAARWTEVIGKKYGLVAKAD